MAAMSPKIPGTRFSEKKKRPDFFEIRRTTDTYMGSATLANHAYGLLGVFTSQSSACRVN